MEKGVIKENRGRLQDVSRRFNEVQEEHQAALGDARQRVEDLSSLVRKALDIISRKDS